MNAEGTGARPREVLVLGATGYVGGRLVSKLLDAGYRVRVLSRSPSRAERFEWAGRVRLFTGDVLDAAAASAPALEGCDAAYYLVHSHRDGRRVRRDRSRPPPGMCATRPTPPGCAGSCTSAGWAAATTSSAHLASRHRVGEILASGRHSDHRSCRAAVIIGSGSASQFEMLLQPHRGAAGDDHSLAGCAPALLAHRHPRRADHPRRACSGKPAALGRVFEVGGPDVVTYAEMMALYAEVAGLRRRILVPVTAALPPPQFPVGGPLSPRWPAAIARPV